MFAVEIANGAGASEAERYAGSTFCPSCGKWYGNSRWYYREIVEHMYEGSVERKVYYDGNGTAEDPGREETVYYVGDYSRVTEVYECPQCYTFVESVNNAESDEREYTHLCGCCGEAYDGQSYAQDCCSDLAGTADGVPDPEVFARAARGES